MKPRPRPPQPSLRVPRVTAALELPASELPELERQPLVDRMAKINATAGAATQDRGSPGADEPQAVEAGWVIRHRALS